MHTSIRNFVTVLVSIGALTACGSADDTGLFEVSAASRPSETAATPPADGSQSVAGVESGSHLWLTFQRVRIHVATLDDIEGTLEPQELANEPNVGAGHEPETPDVDTAPSGWYTVSARSERLDLFDTLAEPLLLGSVTVPAGKVTELRLILSDEARYETPSATKTVRCPSCTQSGLKVPLDGGVPVASGQRIRLTLVFDSNHVLRQNPHGHTLSPVIHARVETTY